MMGFPPGVFSSAAARGGGAPPFVQTLPTFDGTDYFTNTSLSAAWVDGPQGLISIWMDVAGADGVTMTLLDWAARVSLVRSNSDKLQFILRNPASTILWQFNSTASFLAADGLTHIALAWNLAASPVAQFYVNGVSVARADVVAPTPGDVDLTRSSALIGFGATPSSGASPFIGQLGLTFDTAFLDLSVPANLATLISGGNPVAPQSYGQVYFGGNMTVAEWNAGNGRGAVQSWTVNGAVS